MELRGGGGGAGVSTKGTTRRQGTETASNQNIKAYKSL